MLSNRCPMKCYEKVSDIDRANLFSKFYNMGSKNEQDIYLQGLLEVTTVGTKRKRSGTGREKQRSFLHFISVKGTKIKVCLGAFLGIHGISKARVKRLKLLLANGETPKDKRGQNPRANAIKEKDREEVRNHIQSFPVKESHYSGKDYKYLDARLNVKIMYDLFKKKFSASPIKYSYYIKFFHENFQLHFGRPQVDTCITCEDMSLKLKSQVLGDEAKRVAAAEKIVHQRRAKNFYNALKATAEECKHRDDLVGLAFDFMQNLQLPEIPVQDLFYLSQLSVSVFCITDLKTEKSFLYIYHEGIAAKGPNEVCSFLMDYIRNHISVEAKELRLFSDNCPGQNKNHCLIRMCMGLVESGRFSKIEQIFPVRGHSFLPCDRVFGTIKRKLRKHDRVYNVHEYTELIILSSASNAFAVKEVKTEDILDFKNWWPKHYKVSCFSRETENRQRSEKIGFAVSKFLHFIHESPGIVRASQYINALIWNTFTKLKLPATSQRRLELPTTQKAYKERLPILETKLQNLKTLLRWVDDDNKKFYEDIIKEHKPKPAKKSK